MDHCYSNYKSKYKLRANPGISKWTNHGNEIQSRFHNTSLNLLDWQYHNPHQQQGNLPSYQSQQQSFATGSGCYNDPLTGSHSLPSSIINASYQDENRGCHMPPDLCTNCNDPNDPVRNIYLNPIVHNCCGNGPQLIQSPSGLHLPRIKITVNKCQVPQYADKSGVNCGDPNDPSWVTGNFGSNVPQNAQGGAEGGMPACGRCIHLHCKCGLCQQCRVYNYVKSISQFNYPPQDNNNPNYPNNLSANNRKPKKKKKWGEHDEEYDLKMARLKKSRQYEPNHGKSKQSKGPTIIGGPLMTEYRFKYQWPNPNPEEQPGKGPRSRSRGKGGLEVPVPKAGKVPNHLRDPWNPSIKIDPAEFSQSLRAAEDQLAELDRILAAEHPEVEDVNYAKATQSTMEYNQEREARKSQVKGRKSGVTEVEGLETRRGQSQAQYPHLSSKSPSRKSVQSTREPIYEDDDDSGSSGTEVENERRVVAATKTNKSSRKSVVAYKKKSQVLFVKPSHSVKGQDVKGQPVKGHPVRGHKDRVNPAGRSKENVTNPRGQPTKHSKSPLQNSKIDPKKPASKTNIKHRSNSLQPHSKTNLKNRSKSLKPNSKTDPKVNSKNSKHKIDHRENSKSPNPKVHPTDNLNNTKAISKHEVKDHSNTRNPRVDHRNKSKSPKPISKEPKDPSKNPNTKVDPKKHAKNPNPKVDTTERSKTPNPKVDHKDKSKSPNPKVDPKDHSKKPNPEVGPKDHSKSPNPKVDHKDNAKNPNPKLDAKDNSKTPNPIVQKDNKSPKPISKIDPKDHSKSPNPKINPKDKSKSPNPISKDPNSKKKVEEVFKNTAKEEDSGSDDDDDDEESDESNPELI